MRDFNFFSTHIRERRAFQRKMITSVAISMLVVLGIGGGYGFTEYKAYMLEKDIASMEAYLKSDEVIQKKKEIQQKRKKIEILNKYSQAVETLSADINRTDKINSKLVEEINSTLPRNIVIKQMALTQSTLSIQGESQSRTAVAELFYNLRALGAFENVHVGSISGGQQEQPSNAFDIECTLKDVMEQ